MRTSGFLTQFARPTEWPQMEDSSSGAIQDLVGEIKYGGVVFSSRRDLDATTTKLGTSSYLRVPPFLPQSCSIASADAPAKLRVERKWESRPECAVRRSRFVPVRNRCPPMRLVMNPPNAPKTR